jgi:hypothetical protein
MCAINEPRAGSMTLLLEQFDDALSSSCASEQPPA